MSSDSTPFPFTDLPPEVRLEIWELCLPKEQNTPALVIYDRHAPAGDSPLVPLRLLAPLLSVCWESRYVALTWADSKGFHLDTCRETGIDRLVRKVDPSRDIFRMSRSDIKAFLHGHKFKYPSASVHIAVSRHITDQNMGHVVEVCDNNPEICSVAALYDEVRPLSDEDEEASAFYPRRWRLTDAVDHGRRLDTCGCEEAKTGCHFRKDDEPTIADVDAQIRLNNLRSPYHDIKRVFYASDGFYELNFAFVTAARRKQSIRWRVVSAVFD